MSGTARLVGIDPGSRHTGWGIIEVAGSELRLIECGVIHAAKNADTFSDRLVVIYDELRALLEEWKPTAGAVETVFHARNAQSALKLGQARAAALLALAHAEVPVAEYAPRAVKLAVTGNGGAAKDQVARMVEILVGKTNAVRSDATDALAIAICHAAHTPRRSQSVG